VLEGLFNKVGIEVSKEIAKLVKFMITFIGYFGSIIRWVWGVISIMRGYKFNFVSIIRGFLLLDFWIIDFPLVVLTLASRTA
jgi:hypothetical protein